jgi:hypothetical protein
MVDDEQDRHDDLEEVDVRELKLKVGSFVIWKLTEQNR